MPITAQQQKAISFNKFGWRSAKHLRQAAQRARGKPGVSVLADLAHANKADWVETKKPEWAKERYYRLTKKGRNYLEKMRFKVASEAFRLGESIKLSASRSELQRLGWYSVKHVGRIADKWVEGGYYERATFFRQRQNGTFYRMTPAGRLWAKERLRRRMEADLRENFKWERQRAAAKLKKQISQTSQLIKAWSR